MPTAEILSQGDEVVTGQTVDTNAAWLSSHLTALGCTVTRHSTVGDRLGHLHEVLTGIAGRCDLCVCTGGLGPTEDDLTAEAVAEAFARPLALDEVALASITERYARFARDMPAVNRKQALLPGGAIRLDNDWGTAPGFAVQAQGTLFVFLPGVPREMRAMVEHRVDPLLRERLHLRPARLVTLRTTGIAESRLQARLADLALPDGVVLGFRTMLPENHVKLRFAPDTPDDTVQTVVADVASRIGSPLFAVEPGLPSHPLPAGVTDASLPAVVGWTLAARGETVATAESCTGGQVAALLTSVPGSSGWFVEGVVAYANEAKVRLVGVDPATLAADGAVSEPVARQLAEGVRARAGATWGLGTTGVAGPGGGSDDKPVGTVHFALAGPDGTTHRVARLPGDRARIQSLAAAAALDLLRRNITSP